MMTTRFARTSVAALAVLVAGGCGSAATTDTSAPPSPLKLSLAKASARTGAADAAAPDIYPIRPTKYVLDGTLPHLGKQALVYRWTAHAVDLTAANRIAEALGIDAPATATADGFSASDDDATLTVTTAGGSTQVSYYLGGNVIDGDGGGSSGESPPSTGTGIAPDQTEPDPGTANADDTPLPIDKPVAIDPMPIDPGIVELPPKLTPPVDVPNADDAEEMARALLDNMGVLDGQQWDSEVNASGAISITCAVGSECSGVPEQVTARDVFFAPVLDGVRVSGVGWTVTIGEHRQIQSVYGEWASAVVLGTYDLRSTTDAFDALQKGDANFGGREALAGDDVPVKAQAEPAPAVDEPTGREPGVDPSGGDEPIVDDPTPVDPTLVDPGPTEPVEPIEVHVTGVSLGLSRWDAVDGNQNVVDLVPTYVFHTTVDGTASDIEQLALDPAAIDFADPIIEPLPVPQPGEPTPLPAPDPRPKSSAVSKATPGS